LYSAQPFHAPHIALQGHFCLSQTMVAAGPHRGLLLRLSGFGVVRVGGCGEEHVTELGETS